MGEHTNPRYAQVILVSGYPVSTAVNWSQHWCPKCVHYQFSCAPKLAGKYEIEHWCPVVRTDGRCTVTWLPNFLGWVDFLSYGAPRRACGAPLLTALLIIYYNNTIIKIVLPPVLLLPSQVHQLTPHMISDHQLRKWLKKMFIKTSAFIFKCY